MVASMLSLLVTIIDDSRNFWFLFRVCDCSVILASWLVSNPTYATLFNSVGKLCIRGVEHIWRLISQQDQTLVAVSFLLFTVKDCTDLSEGMVTSAVSMRYIPATTAWGILLLVETGQGLQGVDSFGVIDDVLVTCSGSRRIRSTSSLSRTSSYSSKSKIRTSNSSSS